MFGHRGFLILFFVLGSLFLVGRSSLLVPLRITIKRIAIAGGPRTKNYEPRTTNEEPRTTKLRQWLDADVSEGNRITVSCEAEEA